MIKILITGAGALLGQEIFHSLKYQNKLRDLFIGFADPSQSAVGLYGQTLPIAFQWPWMMSISTP